MFLPQQRAVNLIKACQQWITSDEDLEEDVQSEMTLVFASLVPILSNVPGSHWDLVFDVVENNLEVRIGLSYFVAMTIATNAFAECYFERPFHLCFAQQDTTLVPDQ